VQAAPQCADRAHNRAGRSLGYDLGYWWRAGDMTAKRRRGRKWAMLEAVATAMLHGWTIINLQPGHCLLWHRATNWGLWIDGNGISRI
jgi:hypothetical protein